MTDYTIKSPKSLICTSPAIHFPTYDLYVVLTCVAGERMVGGTKRAKEGRTLEKKGGAQTEWAPFRCILSTLDGDLTQPACVYVFVCIFAATNVSSVCAVAWSAELWFNLFLQPPALKTASQIRAHPDVSPTHTHTHLEDVGSGLRC